MKRVKKILKGRYSRKVIIYLLMCCLVLNTSLPAVLATPSGAVPDLRDGGGMSITYRTGPYDHTTLVNVDTTRTIINWESLDTKGGAVNVRETLAFTQDHFGSTLTNSAVLNRVSGPATQFNGDLSAPGMRIFMVNPAGILFGEGSTVNVTQLVASGLNMSNGAFIAYLDNPVNNRMEFVGGNGIVTSRANITADSVYLIGKKVYNIGPIQAPNGLVVMAAGDEVRLYENGSEVSVVVSDIGDGNPDIRNSGYVSANNGKIVLAVGDTFSRAIRNVSIIAASGGEVSMQAAQIDNNGLITVSSSSGNGGSVNLKGTESVTIGPEGDVTGGHIEANAGVNGDGGSVTIETEGLFRIDEDSSITASGGSVSGKGGSVTITSGDFEILGDISASPGNKTEEPGMLKINTPGVIIADGVNTGATDTLYEVDIEALSQGAASLIVNAQEGITVKDITDGEITGQFGNIELHATGDDSAVTFADNTDTIRTTLGDIIIEAGSGGINVGNLTTGKDLSDEKPNPGQILLTTNNGGDITTGDLLIRTGWGLAKIDAQSSGNLTVNGDVIVGSESDVLNVPNGQNAHAAVYLNAADNVELNGNAGAYAQGIDDDIMVDDKTMAEIRIIADTDQDMIGDAFINGDIVADAQSSSQGTAEAVIEVDAWGNITFAEGAGAHAITNSGDGGSVTIQTDGLFRMDENSSITAAGVGDLGNGGSVTITCDDFEILGDISASPGNKSEEPGKLEINTPNVIIADGANTGATDTLYEDDIEALSQGAVSLIVNAQEGITVKDITDGEITGQFGNIELHATGDDSAVTFTDNTDTIRTTLGDIIIEAGSGGINVGNLTTGKDLSDEKPTPGQILLTTNNGGNITTGDLLIRTGWGLAKIDVESSGNLTVNGDVIVGSESDVLNVPNGQNAHAAVYLNAADNVELNGNVGAYAQGIDDEITEGDITMAEIRILAGTDQDLTGDAFINGDIVADAQSSNQGIAEAVIEVDAFGNVTFAEGVKVHAIADGVAVESTGPEYEDDEAFSEEDPPDHAQIIINSQDYPTPPLIGIPDEYSTPKRAVLPVDVLANDTQNGEPLAGGTINSYTEPTAGTLTPTMNGDKIVGLTYNPPEDLSTLTFDENGKATVTFTYVGKVVVEDVELISEETTVTITLVNNLPAAVNDLSATFKNKAININVLTNDTDLDLDDVLTAIEGAVTPKNGTLVLNEDGTFTYTPNNGFLGNDSFTYSVTDGSNTSSAVEVKITVTEEPPAPLPYIKPAPGLDKIQWIDVEISGCPALAKWVAKELGVDERMVDIWMVNSLASTKGIQPYDTYSRLRKAALILQDADGSHIAALVQVINEFASSTAPPTEEQMVAIADAIRRNTDEDSYYAIADEYLDALVTYTGIMSSEMGISTIKSAQFITYKYISRLTQDQNVGVGAFLAACLAALGG